jgi:hypothetical protein
MRFVMLKSLAVAAALSLVLSWPTVGVPPAAAQVGVGSGKKLQQAAAQGSQSQSAKSKKAAAKAGKKSGKSLSSSHRADSNAKIKNSTNRSSTKKTRVDGRAAKAVAPPRPGPLGRPTQVGDILRPKTPAP